MYQLLSDCKLKNYTVVKSKLLLFLYPELSTKKAAGNGSSIVILCN